jgi:hypothetical protein
MPPRAEDHLEPDISVLGGSPGKPRYDMALREALGEIFEFDIAVRMIGMPSFVPEYAVGLRKTALMNGTRYRVVALTLAKPITSIQPVTIDKNGQLHAPPLPWKRDLTRCETSINDSAGERIVEVWRKMLMRTRYSQQNARGTDGATYDFSMFVLGLGDLSGNVWLPERNSGTGTLVALANEMYDICTKQKGASMDKLEKLTAELEQRLK